MRECHELEVSLAGETIMRLAHVRLFFLADSSDGYCAKAVSLSQNRVYGPRMSPVRHKPVGLSADSFVSLSVFLLSDFGGFSAPGLGPLKPFLDLQRKLNCCRHIFRAIAYMFPQEATSCSVFLGNCFVERLF